MPFFHHHRTLTFFFLLLQLFCSHAEEVSFQGQHMGEHFTMQVEEGHQLKCFESKEELIDAVDQYRGYNHVDMDLASTYGWPIGNWCLRGITDLSDLFYDRQFNEDIGKWDVSKVTDMTAMFQNALEFNQDLSLWDTSKVTSMSRMFAMAKSFNSDITKWDVSSVKTTSYMFLHALAFNQDISDWNVEHIQDMERMLRDARTFQFKEQVEKKWKHHEEANTHRMLDNCGEF
jgi:surface protein